MPSGPCIICGDTNYPPSGGGPTICPSCDCGNFGIGRIKKQGKRIQELEAVGNRLQAECNRLRIALNDLTLRSSKTDSDDGYITVNDRKYPSSFPPGTRWSTDEAWDILDTIKDGVIPDDVRAFLAGMIAGRLEAGRLERERDKT